MKKILLLLPLLAFMSCSTQQQEETCPILSVEGGQIQGDWDLSEKMLTAWTNFVKYSDPNGEGQGLGWEPCTAENPQFMLFKLDASDAEASEMGDPILPE